jgi:hypothetical protein
MRKTLRQRLLNLVSENRKHDVEFVSADPETYTILGDAPVGDFLRVNLTPTDLGRGFMLVGKRGWVHTDYVSFKKSESLPEVFCPWFMTERGLLNVTKVRWPHLDGVLYQGPEWRDDDRRASGLYEGPARMLLTRSVICHQVRPKQIWAPPELGEMPWEVVDVVPASLRGAECPRVVLVRRDPYQHGSMTVWLPDLYLNWSYGIIMPAEAKAETTDDAYDKLRRDDLL